MVVFCRYRRIVRDPSCPLRMILFFLTTTYFKDFEWSVKSRHFSFCNVSRCFDFITSSRSNATKDQTKLGQQVWIKAPERRVCNIYSLSFILVGSCFTYKLDRWKFWTTLLLLVFTQAFHKISIQTSTNNTENMPQVTRSNNSAISIDNDASDLWLLVNFVLFLFIKNECYVSSNFGQMTNRRQVRCT